MRKQALLFVPAWMGLVACEPAAPAESPTAPPASAAATVTAPAPRTTTMDADTPQKTASGARFSVPRGWHLTELPDRVIVEEPDKELRIVLLERPEADLGQAIEAAWKAIDPAFSRKLEETVTPPPRDGWDAIRQDKYEVLSSEQKLFLAIARRKDKTAYVTLVEGKLAALDRRGAQLALVFQSFKAPGVEEESFAGKKAHPLDGARLDKLDAFIERARVATRAPGLAVAVVQGGKVVFEKGYGTRELGKKDAVTPATLFMIGSTTKSLTSLLIAKAIEEGKMSWDTKVTEVLPTFALGDAEATRRMSVKHTVCACTGLPRQDLEFLFEWKGATAESRLDALKTMKPTTGFGETFQYSNLLVSAGGFLAGRAFYPKKKLGEAYATALREKILLPAGMKSSTLDPEAAKRALHATPHGYDYKMAYAVVPLAVEGGVTSVGPAGALWSNVRDMARYLQIELGKGKTPEGKQVAKEESILERRKPQVKIGEKDAYGLGVILEDDHGVPIAGHDGNTLGFTSMLFYLPDHDVGLVLLANAQAAGSLRRAVRRRLIEILFDGKETAAETLDFQVKKIAEQAAKEAAEIKAQVDPVWAKKLTGAYEAPGLGKIIIAVDAAGTVTLDAGEWKVRAGEKTESDGTRKLVSLDAPLPGLELLPRQEGHKVELDLVLPQKKYTFTPLGKR